MLDVDDLIASLDEPQVSRSPLGNGINPWKIIRYDPSETARVRYLKELDEHGVDLVCETCGGTFRVHPTNAVRAKACSQACRDKAYKKRRKGEGNRPAQEVPWKPWEHRRNHATH